MKIAKVGVRGRDRIIKRITESGEEECLEEITYLCSLCDEGQGLSDV